MQVKCIEFSNVLNVERELKYEWDNQTIEITEKETNARKEKKNTPYNNINENNQNSEQETVDYNSYLNHCEFLVIRECCFEI